MHVLDAFVAGLGVSSCPTRGICVEMLYLQENTRWCIEAGEVLMSIALRKTMLMDDGDRSIASGTCARSKLPCFMDDWHQGWVNLVSINPNPLVSDNPE